MKLIKLLRFLQAFLRLFISEITNRNQVHPRHYAIFEIFFKHFVYKQELDTNVKGRIFNWLRLSWEAVFLFVISGALNVVLPHNA